jgi:hypothetical protein
MKDAQGHGSDSHSTGVQSVGQTAHHWEKRPSGFGVDHRLMSDIPFANPDVRNLLGMGSVVGSNRTGYVAHVFGSAFRYGAEPSPGQFKSVSAGKKWVEGRLKGNPG